MTKAIWLRLIVILIGLAAIISLIWFAGPLVRIGDMTPFDNPVTKYMTIISVFMAGIGYFAYDMTSRWKSSADIAKNLAGAGGGSGSGTAEEGPQDDGATLKTRMTDALQTLKKTTGAKGDYLYDLPWYVIIGPPGAGKTTALVNSGLKFPLARGGASPAAIAGEGGTRYCDWWCTEDAVLIDTAGRYTTQDSDSKADKSSWLSFLDLLRKNRPKQPINGVFVCISIEDLLRLPEAQLRAHSDAIRNRLVELHDHLKVDFPVYALFTKADLIAGFMEFFRVLNEEQRRAVWGVTFQTADKTANMVAQIPEEFDLLIERLNEDVVDRIQEEPTPQAKVQIFGFPSQMAALKQPVFDFLNRIFEPTRYHTNATLRGFYFASGTQEGTPLDQLVGALSRSFGAENVGQVQMSGLGKSFFLTDLLQKVVFEESGWVSTNISALRRARLIKIAGYAVLAMLTFGLGGALWYSYTRNADLVSRSYASVTQYKTVAGPLREETSISDHDFGRVIAPLHHLRNMPAGFAQREDSVPLTHTVGLNQKPRINASTESAYDTGLQRLLRPRMIYLLESRLRANITNPGYLTEALKIYLMLGGKQPMDKAAVTEWFKQELDVLVPGAGNAPARQSLLEHVGRLLDLEVQDSGPNSLEIDGTLVQEAQNAIGRMTVADRAFELLRSGARGQTQRDWVARRKGGQDTSLVFEGANGIDLETVRVPFFYTYAGFHEAFLGKIGTVRAQVGEERKLLGTVAEQAALQAQYEQLPLALLDRYRREFIAVWQAELRKLRLKVLTADKPRYLALQAAASPTSPIAQIIESIREETALTKEKDKPAAGGQQPAAGAAAPPPAIVLPGGEAPGASIEQAFRGYALLVEGDRSRRPVDELTKVLNDVYAALTMINDPARTLEGRQKFAESLKSFETTAGRFPEPFKALLQTAAASFDTDAADATVARINQTLFDQVTNACQQAIAQKYPFARTSTRDMTVDEFKAMFGPGGTIDRYFQANLAPYANTSGRTWTWNQASPVGRRLSPAMLRNFQLANEIKQGFFPAGATGFSFAVKNLRLADDVDMARLEINSAQLVTERPKAPPPPAISIFGSAPPAPPAPPPGPAPVVIFQWPGPVGLSGTTVTLLPESPGRSNVLQRQGPWGIFRLLNEVPVSVSGDAMVARVSVGGREVQYQINAVSLPNPFVSQAVRNFSCPVAR
ncbi:MAG: type VI secretion system membrane subunit TssM [Beijerinckiaceae bacterium]